jgi:hypothetical protein
MEKSENFVTVGVHIMAFWAMKTLRTLVKKLLLVM